MKQFRYVVRFFFKEEHEIPFVAEKPILDAENAESIAWGAIRSWLTEKRISNCDYIRNVRWYNDENSDPIYCWDILPTAES